MRFIDYYFRFVLCKATNWVSIDCVFDELLSAAGKLVDQMFLSIVKSILGNAKYHYSNIHRCTTLVKQSSVTKHVLYPLPSICLADVDRRDQL